MRVAIIVPNPCNPDFRVVKQAETIQRAGHTVKVFCAVLKVTDCPDREVVCGVEYLRRAWAPKLILYLFFLKLIGQSLPFGDELAPTKVFFAHRKAKSAFEKNITDSTKKSQSLNDIFKKILSTAVSRLKRFLFLYLKSYSLQYVFTKEISDWRPDVVYSHDGAALLVGYKICKKIGAHFLYDSHELEAHRSPPLSWIQRKRVEWEEKKYLPGAHTIFTVGHKIASHLAANYSIKTPIVLFNSPTLAKSNWPETWQANSGSDLRKKIKAGKNAIVFVYTGNVAFGRGIEDVIQAIGKLQNENISKFKASRRVNFAMVGKVTDSVRENLSFLAEGFGVRENIHFVEPVAANSVVDFISSADAAVIPVQPKALSYQYAMPNKLFEALAASLPIIGSNLSEMGPFINKNQIGETFKPYDIEDLAEKMRMIVKNPKDYVGRQRFDLINKYSWEAQEIKLLSVLDTIAAERLTTVK